MARERTRICIGVLLVLFTLSVLPQTGLFAETSDELVAAVTSLGTHLDPHRPPGSAAHLIMHLYDGLTRLDAEGDLHPSLAVSWEAIDETTWRFRIAEGVTFHNGEELDAHVVKMNFDRMMDPNEPRASYTFRVVESYEVVDDYTLDVTTVAPDPLLAFRMSSMLIAPASMVVNPKSDEFNSAPVGTGPFAFADQASGDYVSFIAHENYFLGAPSIGRVTFREIPEKGTQVAELITGGVDLVEMVPPELLPRVEQSGLARVVTAPSPINNIISLRSDIDSPVAVRKVRQAMNYAVDVEAIIDTVLGGYANRYATVVHPFVLGYNPDVSPFPYDPDKARELLAEAGYPNGFAVDFDVNPAIGGHNIMEVAEVMVAQLAAVGIQVRLNSVEYGVMVDRVLSLDTVAPMFAWDWKTWYNDPDGVLNGLFHSSSIASFTRNAALDELIEAGRHTLDTAAREQIYEAVQVLLKYYAPGIFLYYADLTYGVSNRVEWGPRADERLYFYGAILLD